MNATVPGGKYRLTDLQVRIERLLGDRVHSVKSLAREPAIIAFDLDQRRRSRDRGSLVRAALGRMEQLGLVERVQWSPARHGYRLSDESSLDLAARGDENGTQS